MEFATLPAERIHDALAMPFSHHDRFAVKRLEVPGRAGLRQTDHLRELGDATRTLRQCGHKAEARGIAQAGEEATSLGGCSHCMQMHNISADVAASREL